MSEFLKVLSRHPSRLIALATTTAAIALFLAPAPDGVPPLAIKGTALGLFAVGLYATVAVPEFLTALAFFTIAMVFDIAPASTVFAGFHSTAFWLVFGGLIIGVAVNKTGLGKALATAITARLSGGYLTMLTGVVAVGIALAFVMPSTLGRIVLLIPIVLALADSKGFTAGSNERTGLVLATACGTWMPSAAILPANVPNMVLSGVAENLFDVTFTYGTYMLTHLPVNGLLKAALIVAVAAWAFPANSTDATKPAPDTDADGLNRNGRRLAVILALTLCFWITDFVHHISPAWIALAAAVACLMPGIDLVNGDDLKTKVNFPSAFYVAGVLSLGSVLVNTGAGDWIGGWLLNHIPFWDDGSLPAFLSMVGLGTVLNMASTAASVPAIVGPLADDMSRLSGMPLQTVLMTQVIAYSTVILPYQAPPVIVGMQLGGVSIKDGAKFTVILAVLSLLTLVPLNYIWWAFLDLL